MNSVFKIAAWLLPLMFSATPLLPQANPVTPAINGLGLDLLRAQSSAGDQGNLLLSPYSIEAALALAYTGASGRTREEMRRVMHLPGDDAAVVGGFASLAREFDKLQAESRRRAEEARKYGSADFDRMAPRKPDDYLCLSMVFHRTWLSLDENGTEAAAATAYGMVAGAGNVPDPPPPVEVRVDRPFLFAIQETRSGTCLFLGHVTDPR